ncbi:dGTP triphosphohydrolase [Marivirga sp.]|uniref:dGTP triphosphohydrolase n=1 Tax=Marivirga sp. TaxID=2018662 RepID=UPI003DA7269C
MSVKSLYIKSDFKREKEPEPFENNLEPEDYRSSWRRDYARLIHAPSFRRLQGKTQLFPGVESDFFRNRLTHSIEVAQIAKSIALRINYNYNKYGKPRKKKEKSLGISPDLVEFAGLAHDLGHPPFGHQGEEALDECMMEYGGFEGNAQTIRLLTKIEKKFKVENSGFIDGKDKRVGLNLSMRTIASVLKYDRVIPENKADRLEIAKEGELLPVKGYYKCDESTINNVKSAVLNNSPLPHGQFKTVECTIMDIADDIAYSTYDLEDGFKAGFISPMDLLFPSATLMEMVVEKVNRNLVKESISKVLTKDEVSDIIRESILPIDGSTIIDGYSKEDLGEYFLDFAGSIVDLQYRTAKLIAGDGSIRTGFTSSIVGRFIRGAKLEFNKDQPALSKVKLDDSIRIQVEILKTFTFMSQIASPRLKIAEFRGKDIVSKIFNTLDEENGYNLLPDDVQKVYKEANGAYKKRIICDFVSSMTDRYAIEFYGRLISENPETIFKPF